MAGDSGARVRAAGWGWRHAGRRAPAVRGVDLSIEPGERVLLLGPSGSGKSTLLAGLAGLLGGADEGDETGTLLVDGRRPEQQRGRIGLLLQDPDSQVVLSQAGDDVAFGCENLGVPRAEIWRRVTDALRAVDLPIGPRHPTARLSGGQKQRLALAGVLAMRPGLLLLDEPTANLDPDGALDMRDAVGRLVESTAATLVVVEHRTEIWAPLMTRVIVLDPAGGLLADGDPTTVFAERGAELAAAGVWVPHHPVELDPLVPSPGEMLLEASGVRIGRPGGAELPQRIDLRIDAGSSTVVTGKNGAGKSTLALTLAGLIRERGGDLAAAEVLRGRRGLRPLQWSSRELLTRVGLVFQDPEHQFLAKTVADELAVGPRMLGWPEHRVSQRVDGLLDQLGLAALAGANPFTLSGGQKRRLSVATVLASGPRIMILDEPTFGQDRVSWIALLRLLMNEVETGTAVVSVTHDTGVVDLLGAARLDLSSVKAREAA